jgi:hypothetical protein
MLAERTVVGGNCAHTMDPLSGLARTNGSPMRGVCTETTRVLLGSSLASARDSGSLLGFRGFGSRGEVPRRAWLISRTGERWFAEPAPLPYERTASSPWVSR